jgi:Predicted nucleotide-binding protein containing TIR-like domain
VKSHKPSVFIGSSTEGLQIAKELQVLLKHSCNTKIWNQGLFGASQITIDTLLKTPDLFDFAILVFTPDDSGVSRDEDIYIPRDNVLLELGLFMGRLGREKTFVVYDKSKKIKIPSDLNGFTPVTFNLYEDGDLRASLGSVGTEIENAIINVISKERNSDVNPHNISTNVCAKFSSNRQETYDSATRIVAEAKSEIHVLNIIADTESEKETDDCKQMYLNKFAETMKSNKNIDCKIVFGSSTETLSEDELEIIKSRYFDLEKNGLKSRMEFRYTPLSVGQNILIIDDRHLAIGFRASGDPRMHTLVSFLDEPDLARMMNKWYEKYVWSMAKSIPLSLLEK